MDFLSRHAKLSTQGVDAWSMSASNCARVMDAHARAHCIRKIAGQRQRETSPRECAGLH